MPEDGLHPATRRSIAAEERTHAYGRERICGCLDGGPLCARHAAFEQGARAADDLCGAPAGAPFAERRAAMVYEATRLHAAATGSRVVPEPWQERERGFRDQLVSVVTMMCGPERKTDPEALHEDWVEAYTELGWRYGPVRDTAAKTHPDMVPFSDLPLREQQKDMVFVALCEIARQYLAEEGG